MESMAEYEAQLISVEKALLTTQDGNERQELQSLRDNLIELLALTQYANEQNQSHGEGSTKEEFDDQMQQFMIEVKQIECNHEDQQKIKDKYEKMVGEKCRAPHKHSWGAVAYHNAVICGIADEGSIDDEGRVDISFRILFTNPTHREMMPCSYFLDGECRFSDENCHFSHGELVPVADVLEYSAPDFSRISRNCIVLAKLDDNLWHRGRVLCANFIEKQCRVRLDSSSTKVKEKDLDFEFVLPIDQESADDISSSCSDSEDYDFVEDALLKDNNNFADTFTYQVSQPLGDWEKYTRGIGSKLMAKMGYINGSGLGINGRGIVTPVTAQILPPGRSLDHCMELREAANGDKNLFNAEKKMAREQKRQEAINIKAYECKSSGSDVFSFLNNNILTTNSRCVTVTPAKTSSLQNHTIKTLNVESVRIDGDIRRKEKEIAEIQKSIVRNANGSVEVCNRLQKTLKERSSELGALQSEQKHLTTEQACRKTREKLCVF